MGPPPQASKEILDRLPDLPRAVYAFFFDFEGLSESYWTYQDQVIFMSFLVWRRTSVSLAIKATSIRLMIHPLLLMCSAWLCATLILLATIDSCSCARTNWAPELHRLIRWLSDVCVK